MKSEYKKHPAFGMIRFSRISGNGTFFGSPLNHDHFISLEINHGSIKTDLGQDWYSEEGQVIRLRMTSTQFSELITSLNYGCGVPCTLESIQGRKVEPLPIPENTKHVAEKEFDEKMSNFIIELEKSSKRANDLISKKTLSKNDQEELNWVLQKAIQMVKSNIPFYEEQFKRRTDKLVSDAKHEIENAITQKITAAGLQSLGISPNMQIEYPKDNSYGE